MDEPTNQAWRERLRIIVFEADTPTGKAFDVALLWAIALSVLVVMIESVAPIREAYGFWLRVAEWLFTLAFTGEYVLRWLVTRRPWRYALSFYGIVDLLAILPSYLSLVIVGSQSLLVIRALRLLRVFRVLKLARLAGEANVLAVALRSSRAKVFVFLGVVMVMVIILGSTMYLIEGEKHGFTSIPRSVYWAIVTMTTVGYGDIVPKTIAGQTLSAAVMILGYAIIAVPTGIVTAEVIASAQHALSTRTCPSCHVEGHTYDARFCRQCGARLATFGPPAEDPQSPDETT